MTSPTDRIGTRLPVLDLPAVVLPGMVVTLSLSASDQAFTAIQAATARDGRLVLVASTEGTATTVGVLARVPSTGSLPTGQTGAIVRAEARVRLAAVEDSERSGRWALVTPIDDRQPTPRVEALGRELRVVLTELARLRGSRRLPELVRSVAEPGALADAAVVWGEPPDAVKREVLEAIDVGTRVERVLAWAKDLLAEAQVAEQIRTDVTEGMDRRQREFLLRQQLEAIRAELGEGDDDVVAGYRRRVEELGTALPDTARAAVVTEIDRLERTGSQSPEHGWIRTWLDRVLALAWGERSEDHLDLATARAVLDGDHHGLTDVKDRIVEMLAVRKLRHDRGLDERDEPPGRARRGSGAILTLVGPPGVGKTSLGESIARAMGRRFVRVALGGIRDEAEIRGHRRTYVGSQPGRIVRALTEAGTMNPVILLDEVDKVSSGGWSGDPMAALLEVLDPAQNHTFRDHYLEIDLDLSDVVFLATANLADAIPGPLLDRMDVVRLDGYTEDEKVVIARRHLMSRQLERAGLRPDELDLADDTVRAVVRGYTREAGVRSLERELGRLTRKVAAAVAEGRRTTPVRIDPPELATWLGRAKVVDDVPERTDVPGVATGLAVTGSGGDVLFVEATASDGEPGLTLTGQLGEVMRESAQIAVSYLRSHADALAVDPTALGRRLHVHVPAGAVPKDGPSAGITMTTALVSLATGRAVRPTVGMTGEITLQGKVLPIGGVKQKVLAAHRAGLTEVVLPRRNGPDLDDVPDAVRDAMTFHLVDDYREVLAVAFG